MAIAPFLIISFGTLCKFAMLPDVYILPSTGEEEEHSSFLYEGIDVHIWQHIRQKDLNLCLTLYHYAEVIHLKNKTVRYLFCSCVSECRTLVALLLNWEKQKHCIQLHFFSNLLPIKFLRFPAIYFGWLLILLTYFVYVDQ